VGIDNQKQTNIGRWMTSQLAAHPDSDVSVENSKRSSHKSSRVPHSVIYGKNLHKTGIIASLALVFVVFIIYFFITPYFVRASIGNTIITGKKNSVEYQKIISSTVNSYGLKVEYANNKITSYKLSDLGIVPNYTLTENNLKNISTNIKNRLEVWRINKTNIIFKVDGAKLSAFNSAHLTQIINPPKNANIALSNGQVILSDSSVGKEYGFTGGINAVLSSAKLLDQKPIILSVISVNPPISTEQLTPQKSILTAMLSQSASISINGEIITPSANDIGSWINVDVNPKNGKVSTSVNQANINTYLGRIAYKYTKPTKDQLVLAGADGTTTVIQPGHDGIGILNQAAVAQSISDQVLQAKGISATISVHVTPYGTITTDTYPKWIEVNVVTKKMYVYENSNLVNSFLVSAGKSSTPTPLGMYKIFSKYAVQTMIGADYVQPNVPWINYFKAGGYAIHGNYWRPSDWFGNINSSHGCVGLQVSDAEWVYNWAPIGTPIIIHE